MSTVYYSPYGGKVLAIVPAGPDAEYERRLDRLGIEWAAVSTSDHPTRLVDGKPIPHLPHENHKVVGGKVVAY